MPVLIWSDGRKEARARTVRPPRPPLPPLRRKKQRRRKIGTRYSRKCPQMFSRNHRGSHYLRSNSPILRRAITVRVLAIYWDFERREKRTRSYSSVNIRHHRHQYHIATATMVNTPRISHHYHRKGNTATQSRILHSRVHTHHPCNRTAHPFDDFHLTFYSFASSWFHTNTAWYHSSLDVIFVPDIQGFVSISCLLVAPPPNESPTFDLTHPL